MKLNLPNQPFVSKLAYTLLSLVILGYLVIEGKRILSPLVFACLFSILLLPIAQWLERRCRFGRTMASVVPVILMILFIAALFYFMGAQISRLAGDWPTFKEQLSAAAGDLQNWVSDKLHIGIDKQTNYVQKATSKLLDSGTAVARATLYSLSSVLLFLGFTFIYTFLFLLYRALILQFLVRVFLEENGHLVHDIVEQVQFIIRKYITGILIEMTIVASFVSVVFSVVGVKYAILLGLVTGLFNIIPYVGIFTAMIISALISFATAASTAKMIWVIAILFGTHVIDVNILLPLIVGSKVRINAMITLLGIIIGEMIWGIAGMFLSIPVIAVLKIIFDRVESLKPWGLLLGDGSPGRRKKPSLEKKLEKQG